MSKKQKQIKTEHSFMRDVVDQQYANERKETQYHIQREGYGGGSSVGSQYLVSALKAAGFNLPKKKGVAENRGALVIGHEFHEIDQTHLRNHYQYHPSLAYKDEVYINLLLVRREGCEKPESACDKCKDRSQCYIVQTPIDNTLCKKNSAPYMEKIVKFKHVEKMGWWFAPGAEIVRLGDIKTSGDFGFWLGLNEGMKFNYQAQGMINLKATNQESVVYEFQHKEKGFRYAIELYYDQDVMDEIVERMTDYISIKVDMINLQKKMIELGMEKEMIITADLICESKAMMDRIDMSKCGCLINRGGIDWYSCPYSVTHDEMSDKGKPSMKLDSFCPMAMDYLKEHINEYFQEGKIYVNYAKKEFKCTAITKEGANFKATPKGRKEYVLSAYDAFRKYYPPKAWPSNQSKPDFLTYIPQGNCGRCKNNIDNACKVHNCPITEEMLESKELCEDYE